MINNAYSFKIKASMSRFNGVDTVLCSFLSLKMQQLIDGPALLKALKIYYLRTRKSLRKQIYINIVCRNAS